MTGRKILLIGQSGKGKSTLANVLTQTSNFRESSGSVSETRKVQSEQFQDDEIDYSIIDTPSIGDTKMSDHEVLDIIAKAVYLVKDGLNQVLFVINDRFDQYEMATYNLLRTIIFDGEITKHTTIIRTHFKDFRKVAKCQEDIDSMIREAKEKEGNLKESLTEKESQKRDLAESDERLIKINEEIDKFKRKLDATNLAEIITSCQRRFVHVDNPSLDLRGEDSEKEIKLNTKKRDKSREILLNHLTSHCQGSAYKPAKLAELSEAIAEDYFEYLKKKAELAQELTKLEARYSSLTCGRQTTQTNAIKTAANLVMESNVSTSLFTDEPTIIANTEEERIAIISLEEIAQLQDKKERLRKEIEEKQKVIRQKVLKHIFNNYQAISQELGGDIFLNSVKGEHPWPEIHPDFANKELVIKWLSQGFDYEQTQKWVTALGDEFKPEIDADFCAWLSDTKKLTVDKVKRRSHPCTSIEQLRQEYAVYLGKEIGVLDKHKRQLEKRDWTDLHPDFAKESFYHKKAFQKVWGGYGLTYQDAQGWIKVGFEPDDYWKVKEWKDHNFTSLEAEFWISIGLDKKDAEFATYLKNRDHQFSLDMNLKKLRREFNSWLKDRVGTAQCWLDQNYPKEVVCQGKDDQENYGKKREDVIKLDLNNDKPDKNFYGSDSDKNLTGSLIISDWSQLVELNCSGNSLTSLTVKNCPQLKKIYCSKNNLITLTLAQLPSLTWLNCSNNQLTNLDWLTDCSWASLTYLNVNNNKLAGDSKTSLSLISQFNNLIELSLNNNSLTGSLAFLQSLAKLRRLNISKAQFVAGLEYLSESLETISCANTVFTKKLEDYQNKGGSYNYRAWRKDYEKWKQNFTDQEKKQYQLDHESMKLEEDNYQEEVDRMEGEVQNYYQDYPAFRDLATDKKLESDQLKKEVRELKAQIESPTS